MREDDRLSEALRRVPVPEHGPDYRMRREQAFAGAQPTTTGQGATQEALARRRTVARRVLVAAVAAVGLVAVVAGAVVSTRDAVDRTRSTPLQSPSPSTSPARHSAIVAGAAPTLVGDDLTAVVRGLDGTLWAWGYRHRQGGPGSPLLERWDGSSWQEVALPARRANEIEGVAAISEDDVWVAGNSRRGGRLLHWDGSGWTTYPAFWFTATTETSNALLALGSDDVWAVGSADTPGTLSMHWDGARWRPIAVPVLSTRVGEVSMRLVRGISPADVWVLGDAQGFRRKSVNGDFLLHGDGSRWERQAWPARRRSSGHREEIALDDIAVASDGTLWAAGRRWFGPDNRGDLYVPVVLRLRPGRWQIMASGATPSLPPDWRRFMPSSIAATSSQDVWVAGEDDEGSSLWHWDGSAWSILPLPEAQSPAEFQTRSVLAVGADDVWVLCQGSTTSDRLEQLEPFFMHFDGVTWQRLPAAPQPAP